MIYQITMVPNLGELGVPRGTKPEADLKTIWMTPYPVISNYMKLCADAQIKPFGGGTLERQAPNEPGYILSGYRDEAIEGNVLSLHRFGMAIDFQLVGARQQIKIGQIATNYFVRVGFYPDRGFIHVDLAPEIYIDKYSRPRYWVQVDRKYNHFKELPDATAFITKTFL